MIKETIKQNNNNQKAMLSKFLKRTRKAAVQKRGKAVLFFTKKMSKLRRQRKAMMRIEWEENKKLQDKTSKF
jgi:hypothetical protein